MKRTGLAFVLALAVSLTACAEVANDPAEEVANDPVEEVAEEPTATPTAETSTVQSDQRQRIVDDFTQGVAGTTSCAELFTLRNRLAPDDPYIDSNMNPELQRIRCFNSSSDRGDHRPHVPPASPRSGGKPPQDRIDAAVGDPAARFGRRFADVPADLLP